VNNSIMDLDGCHGCHVAHRRAARGVVPWVCDGDGCGRGMSSSASITCRGGVEASGSRFSSDRAGGCLLI